MKLALGTVQFGMSYGVANTRGQVAAAEVAEILAAASAAGVDTLDTAIAYGESEARLGDFGVRDWKVVSKLPALPDTEQDVANWVEKSVRASLARLHIDRLDGLLLHRPRDLLGARGADYCRALLAVKDKGLATSVGLSIYSPEDLDLLWPVFRPDIVQAPFNILDRRLADSGWLARLHGEGVRVHTRSAFLQGLLLLPPSQRPAYFSPWTEHLARWGQACAELQTSPLVLALGVPLSRPEIERVVVGVDSVSQLNEILAASSSPPEHFPLLACQDLNLIDPSRWKIS